MKSIIKKYRKISYNFFVMTIFIIHFGMLYFVSVPLVFWSVGDFIRGQFKDGILIFILFLLSVTLYLGASEMTKKHNLKLE